jgi:hypothetical protein
MSPHGLFAGSVRLLSQFGFLTARRLSIQPEVMLLALRPYCSDSLPGAHDNSQQQHTDHSQFAAKASLLRRTSFWNR